MEIKPESISINQASQWYVRLSAPDCTPAERRAFRRWLELDPKHEKIYQAAVKTASLVSDQLIKDPRLQALALAALGKSKPANDDLSREHKNAAQMEMRQSSKYSCSKYSGYVGFVQQYCRHAAAVVLGIGLLYLAVQMNEFAPSMEMGIKRHYANNETLQQRIELSDGSLLYLDVGAVASVTMGVNERRLELTKGRAYFEVAHDKSRPFSVTAFGTEVVALGTRFQVDVVSRDLINVTLAEGSVAVIHDDGKNPEAWRDVLQPGEQLALDTISGRRETRSVNADAITSWSSGVLVFDGTPLHQVLDEINRYAKVKVRLGDISLANVPIGGNFVAGSDSSEFVETLKAALPLKSIPTGANEIALFRLYKDSHP